MMQQEKIEQAIAILQELNIDTWLILARETEEMPERAWELVAPSGVVWQGAIFLTPRGDRIAIVGKGDDETYRKSGLYDRVESYTQSIREILRSLLDELRPAKLAVNFSKDNPAADGLTYGMYLQLREYLDGMPYANRLISAEPIISRLRGRKTPSEVDRVKRAIVQTVDLFEEVTGMVKPGVTERHFAQFLHRRLREHELAPAWELSGCPIVNAGPHSVAGHTAAGDIPIEPGQLLHIDFGVKAEGYCSDLQRMWYLATPAGKEVPQNVQRAFDAVAKTIQEASKVLKPGVRGWQVDARAREVITSAGYPEYQHAVGHQLGRTVHDGGTLLGPRWERYGELPNGLVEANQIFTLELGVDTEAGFVGLEEDVLVTESGVEWLSQPQDRPIVVTL